MQAAADEFTANIRNPINPSSDPIQDPRTCLDVCNDMASCLAVFIARPSNVWACFSIEGDFAVVGVVRSAIKAAPSQINRFYWEE